jgi:hypothetical protein
MLQRKYDLGSPRPRSTSCDLLGIAGHDIAEILLKVALNTKNQSINRNCCMLLFAWKGVTFCKRWALTYSCLNDGLCILLVPHTQPVDATEGLYHIRKKLTGFYFYIYCVVPSEICSFKSATRYL